MKGVKEKGVEKRKNNIDKYVYARGKFRRRWLEN